MKRLPIRAARLAAPAFAALGALLSAAASAPAATFVVNIGSNGTSFVDQTSGTNTTTIHAGDTVQWNWVGSTHSTTSGTCQAGGYYGGECTWNGAWDSGQHSSGYSYSHTFDTAGNFNYYCSIHMYMMQGVVVVQAAGNPPAASFRSSPTGPVAGSPVRFVDTSTGSPTSWSWDFGDPASGAANASTLQNPTHTFRTAATYTVTLTATTAGGSTSSSVSVTVAAGGATDCLTDDQHLCLTGGRYLLSATWEKPDGSSGPATAVALTPDSGYFWFFDPTNIELVVKVLAACALNGDSWVFSAGLTNVQVTLTVLDTHTGVSEEYVNPLNAAYQPIQDTGAFATCP
ncbi:MAG TPA: PKD domain-containing protein [Thermoanaerobaculia bacterium]|nr:PKD domain-containing protein [Thermoanaerobaculia bacterium]